MNPKADVSLRKPGEGPVPPLPPPPPLPVLVPVPPKIPSKSEEPEQPCFEVVCLEPDQGRKDIRDFVGSRRWKTGEKDGISVASEFIAIYSHLQPVLQHGPVCGLVALTMAGSLLEDRAKMVQPDEILSEAVKRGYSLKGEMFSTKNMMELASHFYPSLRHSVLDTRTADAFSVICETLIDGNVVLVPYDADFNHGPSLRRGHAAHWAVLHGLLVKLPDESDTLNNRNEDASTAQAGFVDTVTVKSPRDVDINTKAFLKKSSTHDNKIDEVFVICHQGKSLHTGIWKLADLLASNQNLVEIAPKLLQGEQMILTDIQDGLCCQAIIITKKEKT